MDKAIGLDPGTAFFQTAEFEEGDKVSYQTIRNAFVELPHTEDVESILKNNGWKWVKDKEENKYYVIGEDALRVSNIFPGIELRRPMKDGVLNKDEEKKTIVFQEIIDSTLGKAQGKNSFVCTCISSPPADGSQDSVNHSFRLKSMLSKNGWNVNVIEEAMAVIYAENPKAIDDSGVELNNTGIAISFGGGRTNVVFSYKKMKIIGFSISRSGDWLDQKVSEATGVTISQAISKKEKKLDFTKEQDDEVLLAYDAYMTALLEYIFGIFAKKFKEVKGGQYDFPLEIVLAGGTSVPKGFDNKVKEVLSGLQLPFEVKSVRRAIDPRNSVVKGLLLLAAAAAKKAKSNKDDDISKMLGE